MRRFAAVALAAAFVLSGAAVVAAPDEPEIEHVTVLPGEGVWTVARRLCPDDVNTMFVALQSANPWTVVSPLYPGAVLHVAAGSCPDVAPTTTEPPVETTEPPETTEPHHHQMPGVYVDPASIPEPQPGRDGIHIIAASNPVPDQFGVGSFRTDCSFSHMSWDDPIVFPGIKDATHLHAFYGNTDMDYQTTTADNGATSTCSGGTANRSGYWVPAIIDTATSSVVVSDYMQVYYKTGYDFVEAADVVVPPAGLRIVAGRQMTDTTPDVTGRTFFYCLSRPADRVAAMPVCAAGDELVVGVRFPQCWDGTNLDSADHRSHMAYAARSNPGCPTSHPVPLPEITVHVWHPVGPGGTAAWRLSSDVYDGPGGYTMHADWWNGWDRQILDRIRTNCWNPGMDCQMNLLGGGEGLRYWF